MQPDRKTESQGADSAAIQKMRDMMKDIKFCMLTNQNRHGAFRSRPMTLQETSFDGDLWFFAGKDTPLVDEINHDARVNVSFSDTGGKTFVSLSGRAKLVNDADRMAKLWSDAYKGYFPKGLDDPNLALLKVDLEHGEYWDTPHGMASVLWGALKAAASGKHEPVGQHETVSVEN